MQQQMTELQQTQAELNDTALRLVRTQRNLDNTQKQLQQVTHAVSNLAGKYGQEIKTMEDIQKFLGWVDDQLELLTELQRED